MNVAEHVQPNNHSNNHQDNQQNTHQNLTQHAVCGWLRYWRGSVISLGVVCLSHVGLAQTQPSCQQLLEHLNSTFNVAHSVTSTVNIRSGVLEIAYNRSRFDRQGNEVQVTLLEQRGRRTPYDQDVFLDNPPEAPSQQAPSQQAPSQPTEETADAVPLPFDCNQHNLEVRETQHTNDSPYQSYVLSLTNTQADIPVDYWRLEFGQIGNWYVLEQLFAPFEITIVRLPVRGHFTMNFDSWDLPARLPMSPRERLN